MKSILLLNLCMIMLLSYSHAQQKKGFDLSGALVPIDQIVDGGPPRDGIPSIDQPRFVSASQAQFLEPEDRILGITWQGKPRAYPVKILNWHEIVNDTFGDHPVVVTYCPLCGSGMAFGARIASKDRTFGVSGLLYNNDVLLYDRQSESLWSQIMSKAIAGPLKGSELKYLKTTHTTWEKWKTLHEKTQGLSTETGYKRNYSRSPYSGYEENRRLMFPTTHQDDRYHPKEWVLGLRRGGKSKAYPFSELRKASTPIQDHFAGEKVRIIYDHDQKYADVPSGQNGSLEAVIMYWFAWSSFHPDTEVFTAGQ